MRILIAATAALLGLSIAAAQADENSIPYKLPGKYCKVLAPMPVFNAPVHVMGATGFRSAAAAYGVGEVTVSSMLITGGTALYWIGQDSTTQKIESGFSNTPGTHIANFGIAIDLQVWTGSRMRVCNLSSEEQSGTITMFW